MTEIEGSHEQDPVGSPARRGRRRAASSGSREPKPRASVANGLARGGDVVRPPDAVSGRRSAVPFTAELNAEESGYTKKQDRPEIIGPVKGREQQQASATVDSGPRARYAKPGDDRS